MKRPYSNSYTPFFLTTLLWLLAGCPVQAPPADPYANDSGVTTCSDGTQNGLDCPLTSYSSQDAQFGRDQSDNDNSDGHAGFSFTKLDAAGNALAASATSWSCVRDEVTHLVWEVKTTSGLHRNTHTYTWYNSNSSTNGGVAGVANGGSCTGSDCDTAAFVQAVNTEGLCGYDNWRLPNIHELLSIIDFSASSPAIDSNYFPNTVSADYWSADSGINAGTYGPDGYARVSLMTLGYLYLDSGSASKSALNPVRLVRE